MCIFKPFTQSVITPEQVQTMLTDFATIDTSSHSSHLTNGVNGGNFDRIHKIKNSYLVRKAGTDSWVFAHECGAVTAPFSVSSDFTGYLPTSLGHQLVFVSTMVTF